MLAIAASVVVHTLVVVPLLIAVMTNGAEMPELEAHFSSEALRPEQEEPEEREPVLGIEQSSASTLTWIGYDEYMEHLAQFAEVEQAAFSDAPTGSEPSLGEQHPQSELLTEVEDQPVETEVTAAQLAQLPTTADAAPETISEPESNELDPAAMAAQPQPAQPAEAIESLPLPEVDLADLARILEIVGLMSRQREATDPDRPAASSPPSAMVQQHDEELAEASPPQPAQARSEKTPQQPNTPGEPADSADKQTEATSTIEVTHANWRLGKPLAAEGVELKPQRPKFSIMQRLTASPCNPLMEIHFDGRGVATKASFVETSREKSIDAAIEASVYQWRAEGEAIEELTDDQTFAIRIRFILNPYARCP